MNFKKIFNTLLLSGIAIISSNCGSSITYPPISETATDIHNPGQFVWHDLATANPNGAMKFYGDVFGWQFETLGSGNNLYYVIKNQGKSIGGIFQLAQKYGERSEWIASMSVQNIETAVSFNETNGGKTVFEIAEFNGRGKTALIQDPQGALIALLSSASGDPGMESGMNNGWLWNELWTTDLDGSLRFYQGLVQYETEEIEQAKAPYYVFTKDGKKLSGAIKNPVSEARSAWMPYLKVDNVDELAAKAEEAGAYALMKPNQEIRNGTVAVLIDPLGAQFTIQEWQ